MLEAVYNTQTEHTSGTKRMIEEDDEGITQSKKKTEKSTNIVDMTVNDDNVGEKDSNDKAGDQSNGNDDWDMKYDDEGTQFFMDEDPNECGIQKKDNRIFNGEIQNTKTNEDNLNHHENETSKAVGSIVKHKPQSSLEATLNQTVASTRQKKNCCFDCQEKCNARWQNISGE